MVCLLRRKGALKKNKGKSYQLVLMGDVGTQRRFV